MVRRGLGSNVQRAIALVAIALGSACSGEQNQTAKEDISTPTPNARRSTEIARSSGETPRTTSMPSDDVHDVAATSYMKANGVSLEQATERLLIESELSPHIEGIRERYGDRMAFISIESLPYQHLVVGLKGAAMEPTQHINVRGTDVRVEFEEGYPYTAHEFSEITSRASTRVLEFFPDATGLAGRPELGLIEVMVSGTDERRYLPAKEAFEAVAGIEIKLLLGRSAPRNLIDITH